MAWYAYCIAEQEAFQTSVRARRPFPIEGLHGVSGAQVLGYPSGEFAVIVSEYVRNGGLDQRAVLEHAKVVSECFRSTTVLPFRFGTVFDTDEALRRAVRCNRRTFVESVTNLRGKSEMHLKVMLRDGALPQAIVAPLPATAGKEYLTQLRQRAVREREAQTKARALSVQVHKLLNPLQEEICCRKVESGALLIDIAHLIDSKTVPKYQNRCTAAIRQLKDCEVVVSGPWPPYHFMPDKLRTVNS
jgi:hypothetical protein